MAQTPERAAQTAVVAVTNALGELSDDESAKVHGAYYARAVTDVDAPIVREQVQQIAGVLQALRRAPCPWCSEGLDGHTLEVTTYYPHVWCTTSGRSRIAADWLEPIAPPKPRNALVAILMWVGIPLMSCGLLAWLPSMIAAIVARDRTWAIGAVVLGALTGAGLVLSAGNEPGSQPSLAAIVLVVVPWVGGAIFGGLQIQRWLAGSAPRD